MTKSLKQTSTANLTHDEWLEHRRRSIGGSDAAAIVGLNPWASPYSVWAEKTGRLPEKEETEAMRQGKDFEDYVAKRFCEATGKKVRRANAIFHNPLYPFAHANLDRAVVGENAGLECKTTSSLNLKKFKDGEYPTSYYVQCVHYMAVTGADRWYLAVLVLNQGFYTYTIERDEAEIEALMKQEAEFWEHVINDTPPPADGFDVTTDTLKIIFKESNGDSVNLFGREGLIDEYFKQIAAENEIKTKIEEIKQTLMMDMGNCEAGFCGNYKILWKPQVRNTFNYKALVEEYPDIDIAPFFKQSQSRPFLIKEAK